MKKYISSYLPGIIIPFAMAVSLYTGQNRTALMAVLLCFIGLIIGGRTGRTLGILWMALGAIICALNWYHGTDGAWTQMLLLSGAVVMLYQALDEKAKALSKSLCLWAALGLGILILADTVIISAGSGSGIPGFGYLAGPLGTMEAAGLFFATAALSDDNLYRRYIFCVILGMTGSITGLIGIGTGMIYKNKNWQADTLWVCVGLLFLVSPYPLIWLLYAAFMLWCVPEVHKQVIKIPDKLRFIPLILFMVNPKTISMAKTWNASILAMENGWEWNFFLGTGPGYDLFIGGLFQATLELGIIAAVLLLLCARQLKDAPAKYPWIVNLIFGASAFIPAPFLLGAGTGMGETEEKTTMDVRLYFAVMALCALPLC